MLLPVSQAKQKPLGQLSTIEIDDWEEEASSRIELTSTSRQKYAYNTEFWEGSSAVVLNFEF